MATIEELLTTFIEKLRAQDESNIDLLFAEFVARVLTIDGQQIQIKVAGLPGGQLSYQEAFDLLKLGLKGARSRYFDSIARKRIERILTEAVKG